MGLVRVYIAVARLSFRRQLAYRGAMYAAMFTNIVFGVIVAGLMRAVLERRGTVDGWDATDLITYTFAVQALLGPVAAFGERELAQRVMTGEIASDLVRPVPLEGWAIASFTGKSLAQLLVRTVPTFLAGALVFDVRLPDAPTALATAGAVVLGVLIAACWWLILNLVVFWVLNVTGPIQLGSILGYVLGGISFPLVLLPGAAERVVRRLPFAAQVHLPVEVFLGKRTTAAALGATYGLQLLWLGALLGLAHVLVLAGRRKLVVQGG